ncbi:hypothetical protein GSI_09090 [Ganoderma sinense ZZ0214-1]|uniref:FluG domain-containing protein n=1 Tax=Ganoderma sinense ZZ0214-1 TaxID=1077348 RepID=A0A2G8S5J0_9APHY|nr:hypothetical protein GSI_09090 [Ganoderma sinense ZZ0214-1]
MAPQRHTASYLLYNAAFIQSFTKRQAEKQAVRKPGPLTAEQHAGHRERVQQAQSVASAWADNTKANVVGLGRKWERYCAFTGQGSWIDVLKGPDGKGTGPTVAMDFLLWICTNHKIKSSGTLWQYFRQLKQLHAHIVLAEMTRYDTKEVAKYFKTVLIPRFKLRSPNSIIKQVADSGDLWAMLTFTIGYDTGIFAQERHRIQLLAIYLLLAYTGCRAGELVDNEKKKPTDELYQKLFPSTDRPDAVSPSSEGQDLDDDDSPLSEQDRVLDEILSQETVGRGRPRALCYEDVQLMVVRHPKTGQHTLAMKIKFIHHKGSDNKLKPTIFTFTLARRLIFCPVSVIVSLALADGAFEAENMTSFRQVLSARTRPLNCTVFRWKKKWLKRPIFRRCDPSGVSDVEPLQYPKLNDDMARQSLDSGCEKAMEPKVWRRGAANAVNGKAPDAIRDQALRHDPKWATFNSAYINPNITFDFQNNFLDEPAEDELIRMLSHISLMRDPRARKNMVPAELWDQLPADPTIEALKREKARLKNGRYRFQGSENEDEIRRLSRVIRSKEAQWRKMVQKEFHDGYFHDRHTRDLEADDDEDVDEYVEPAIDVDIPERARLAEILCKQPDDLDDAGLFELRVEAGDLMVALTRKRETIRRDYIRQQREETTAQPGSLVANPTTPGSDVDPFPLRMHERQCPRCIGAEDLSYRERTYIYSRVAVRNNHFDRQHLAQLQAMAAQGLLVCVHPKCSRRGQTFADVDGFREHAETAHGVKLRLSAAEAARRKARRESEPMVRPAAPPVSSESTPSEYSVALPDLKAPRAVRPWHVPRGWVGGVRDEGSWGTTAGLVVPNTAQQVSTMPWQQVEQAYDAWGTAICVPTVSWPQVEQTYNAWGATSWTAVC